MGQVLDVESRVTAVEVYRNRALVTRTARLEPAVLAAEGLVRLRLLGLPLSLRDDSLRLGVTPAAAARVLDVHLELALPDRRAPLRDESTAALLDLVRRRVTLSVAREREADRIGLLELLTPTRFKPTELPDTMAFADHPVTPTWLDVAQKVGQQLTAGRRRLRELAAEARALEDRIAEAEDNLRRQSEAWAAQFVDATRSARVRLRAESQPETALELSVSYLVPAARWVPQYELRIHADRTEAEIVLQALVAQNSGEDWDSARLSFSTADLSRSAKLPELPSWRIGKAQPPPQSGWRPLPDNTEELFTSYDAGVRHHDPPLLPPSPELPVAQRLGPELELPAAVRGADAADLVSRLVDRLGQDVAPSDKRDTAEYPPVPQAAAFDGLAIGAPPEPESAGFFAGASLSDEPDYEADYDEEVITGEELFDAKENYRSAPPPMAAPSVEAPAKRRESKRGRRMDEAKTQVVMLRASRPMGFGAQSAGPGGGGEWEASGEPVDSRLTVDSDGLNYADLRLSGPDDEADRGQLQASGQQEQVTALMRRSAPDAGEAIDELPAVPLLAALGLGRASLPSFALPVHGVPVEESAGHFAVRYPMDGPGSVASDGATHLLTLLRRSNRVRRLFRCVPLLDDSVYQVVLFQNPLGLPLLSGPVQVYRGGDFVVTGPLDTTPPDKTITVNLGVEPGITVARNVHFMESTHGLFGGDTSLRHVVEIEARSRLNQPARLEIFERVPLSYDDDIEVKVLRTEPDAETYSQKDRGQIIHGGQRFVLDLEPGQSRSCTLEYQVTIPSKRVLVGGNRRD